MRSRAPVLLMALLLPLGVLAGCSGDDDPEPASAPGLPSQADLRTYFEAIMSADTGELAKVETEIAADGSPAQGFAAYIEESTTAADNAGRPGDSYEVEEVEGGFRACVGEDQCATWSDLRGKDGKLADFTVNGTELTDLLVDLTDQPPIELTGLYEVQPGWAYLQLRTGALLVVCTVTAHDVPLSPRPGVYIEGDKILDGIEGDGLSPATIEAGTSSPVVLVFPDAERVALTGQVTFDLELGDQSTESIGFGLTPPAG